MPLAVAEACSHIVSAIREIEQFVSGRSDDQIIADKLRIRALERCIQIISEAVRHIPADAKATQPHIEWDDIAAIGNVMRHGYFEVDIVTILHAVRFELEPLETAVKAISPIILDP